MKKISILLLFAVASFPLFTGCSSTVENSLKIQNLASNIISITDNYQINITVAPQIHYYTEQTYPLNFEIVEDNFSLIWEQFTEVSDVPFRVTVLNRYGTLIWRSPAITGNSIEYDGPSLSQEQIYRWNLVDDSPDQSFSVNGRVTSGNTRFLFWN